MCRPSVCQCVSCLHAGFYSHIRDVANETQTLRGKEPRPLPLAGLPHMKGDWLRPPWLGYENTHDCNFQLHCHSDQTIPSNADGHAGKVIMH